MKYPKVNWLFTFACFGIAPILGSVVSVVWHGGAIWCSFEVLTGRQKLNRDKAMNLIALFLYAYVAASVLSFLVNGPSVEASIKLIPLLTFLFFPFSYSVWSISEREPVMRAAIFASMAASLGALILALVQHYVMDLRAEGGAGNALVFANVTCMTGAACLAGAFTLERRWVAPAIAAYFASVLAVLYSESRSVWIVMIVLAVMILFIYRDELGGLLKGRFLAIIAVIALAGILTSGLIFDRMGMLAESWDRFSGAGDYKSSLGYRIALWQIACDLFMQSPLIGHGLQNTASLIQGKLMEMFGLQKQFTHFHNGFLNVLVEDGLFGLMGILGVFVTAAVTAVMALGRDSDKVRRFGAVLLLTLVVSYGVGGSVNIIFGHDILDTMFMIFLIGGVYLAAGSSMISARSKPAYG